MWVLGCKSCKYLWIMLSKGGSKMNCPKCDKDMDFDEAKNWHGTWYCDCGFEAEGSKIPCDAEYFIDTTRDN